MLLPTDSIRLNSNLFSFLIVANLSFFALTRLWRVRVSLGGCLLKAICNVNLLSDRFVWRWEFFNSFVSTIYGKSKQRLTKNGIDRMSVIVTAGIKVECVCLTTSAFFIIMDFHSIKLVIRWINRILMDKENLLEKASKFESNIEFRVLMDFMRSNFRHFQVLRISASSSPPSGVPWAPDTLGTPLPIPGRTITFLLLWKCRLKTEDFLK